jgi:hypothetical protein
VLLDLSAHTRSQASPLAADRAPPKLVQSSKAARKGFFIRQLACCSLLENSSKTARFLPNFCQIDDGAFLPQNGFKIALFLL